MSMRKVILLDGLVKWVIRYMASLGIVALTTLLLRVFGPAFDLQIAVLIYIIPVMVAAVSFGLTSGLLASFAAFLAFNYYYIEPFHTFQVHATQDLITLLIFLVVTVVINQLLSQARAGVKLARAREWEATRMYELISSLSGVMDENEIARVVSAHIHEGFHCTGVQVEVTHSPVPGMMVTFPPDIAPTSPPNHVISMATIRDREGEIKIWREANAFSPQEMRLLQAHASQAALSLERVRLVKGENKARVLEESDKLKTSLLNSVSHELRSPLAAIKASVSSLRSGTVDWDVAARQELLATIEEETDELNLLVGNLLDMSRIESGALAPQKQWYSLNEIASRALIRMRKLVDDHQIVMDMPSDLPLVPADYVMIERVYTNLLSNSIKYAPANTQITVSARMEDGYIHATVSNQGPPVPDQHLERIFDKFYRVTEAERITGTGLGLSICKGIIEAHEGRIWASNEPGRFVFHFTLPITLNGVLPSFPEESGNG